MPVLGPEAKPNSSHHKCDADEAEEREYGVVVDVVRLRCFSVSLAPLDDMWSREAYIDCSFGWIRALPALAWQNNVPRCQKGMSSEGAEGGWVVPVAASRPAEQAADDGGSHRRLGPVPTKALDSRPPRRMVGGLEREILCVSSGEET
jgi:hypothetical protein